MLRLLTVTVIVTSAVACSSPRPSGSGDGSRADVPARKADANETLQQRVQRLEREARALARADGCSDDNACRTAPVGERACGGPRTYIAYCARTTDSTALFAKLGELQAAEREYNTAQGLVSTCEFRMPPRVAASGGTCRAVQP